MYVCIYVYIYIYVYVYSYIYIYVIHVYAHTHTQTHTHTHTQDLRGAQSSRLPLGDESRSMPYDYNAVIASIVSVGVL